MESGEWPANNFTPQGLKRRSVRLENDERRFSRQCLLVRQTKVTSAVNNFLKVKVIKDQYSRRRQIYPKLGELGV